ncbi:MAG: hypothetical protein ABIS50_23620 [Luteolibacter sp.]|uniref:hypothetical protein n=1 Tax=Luteolibacter sp. TaxID=1962973 RepID=UPI0032665222
MNSILLIITRHYLPLGEYAHMLPIMEVRFSSNQHGQVVVLNECAIDCSKRRAVEAIVRSYFDPAEKIRIDYEKYPSAIPVLRLPLDEFGNIENPVCRRQQAGSLQGFVGEFKLMEEEIREELDRLG